MPSKCTIYGNFQNLAGGGLPQGTLILELSNIGTGNPVYVSGTSIIPQLKYVVYTAADGSFNEAIWGNDVISPANTIYNVTFRNAAGDEIGPIQYSFTGASVNLNTAVPINPVLPPILAASVGTQTLLNQQGPLAPVVGNASDATLYTFTIPANTVQGGQGIRITTYWSHSTGTAALTYKLKLGTTVIAQLSAVADTNISTLTADVFNNPGVQNAQSFSALAFIGGGSTAIGAATSTVNMALVQTLTLTFNGPNTDQVTPKFWLVEIINGPAYGIGDIARLTASGSALVSGDFVLTGWGTAPTITAIRGCDMAHGFTITAGSAFISAGPTVALTFHDGTWANAPVILADVVGGTGQQAPLVITATAFGYIFTYGGFPQPGQTFIFNVLMMGI